MTTTTTTTRKSPWRVLILAVVCMAGITTRPARAFQSHARRRRSFTRSERWLLQQQQQQQNNCWFSSTALAASKKKKRTTEKDETLHIGKETKTYSARTMDDNGLDIVTDSEGRVSARPRGDIAAAAADEEEEEVDVMEDEDNRVEDREPPQNKNKGNDGNSSGVSAAVLQKKKEEATVLPKQQQQQPQQPMFQRRKLKTKPPLIVKEQPAKVVPASGFNIVLTHSTADFDTLASAVGLAKLWASTNSDRDSDDDDENIENDLEYDSSSVHPTFVVLPRGAHPSVQRFLALHKHLFPIRSLKSLPADLSGLDRLGLVDAQRRDRVGPAEHLLGWANRVTIVDHHIDADSDIPEATDYVVDKVGSVSTLIAERLQSAHIDLTEAEATLLALGIHADTGSLCFDSTTTRDAQALAWIMSQGASQAAIAEHAQASLSAEQQGVLTQALINTNSTVIHGVTVSTVLLSADGFINGLATVTQDALELSSSDVFLLALVYEARAGGSKRRKSKKNNGERLQSRLLEVNKNPEDTAASSYIMEAEAWKGGEEALRRRRLKASFDKKDVDGTGYLDRNDITAALASSGVIATEDDIDSVMTTIDTDGDGKIDFEEFVAFAKDAEERKKEHDKLTGKRACTMIIIGRVKAGVNMKSVNLNKLFEPFGGGGHSKAASTTCRLGDESEAEGILQGIVDNLIETSLLKQPTCGDFMTSPVLSAKPTMTEKQVEDLFVRYDVRALPVVNDNNDVIGLVTYKEVAAAKQRLWNKEQKRLREMEKASEKKGGEEGKRVAKDRKLGSALKGWMKQHVQVIEASRTMAEVEAVLLESDVGCMPVVADGTKQLLGMVTRTDVLRQHRYYPSLHYHNKGFSDSIAARKPIIELRKRLKKFDLDDDA